MTIPAVQNLYCYTSITPFINNIKGNEIKVQTTLITAQSSQKSSFLSPSAIEVVVLPIGFVLMRVSPQHAQEVLDTPVNL